MSDLDLLPPFRAPALSTTFAGLPMDRPHIMGVVNVTPDSFSDGGQFASAEGAADHALRLADEGATILDIGGESTRPGADEVSVQQELDRTIPVIERLTSRISARISIDTRKARVMAAAVAAGAHIINDVSALGFDPDALETASKAQCPIILMHAQGLPKTMQHNPVYEDVVADVKAWLAERLAACEAAGVPRSMLAIDPGIGFGKTVEHNLALISHLDHFHTLKVPVLLGASRKSFIGAISGEKQAANRVAGSITAALVGLKNGAQMLRVHDVAQTRQAILVAQQLNRF